MNRVLHALQDGVFGPSGIRSLLFLALSLNFGLGGHRADLGLVHDTVAAGD